MAEVEVDSAGQQSGRVSWDAGDGGFRDPSIRAHWFRRRGAAFRLDAGAVWIEWYNPVPPGPRPSRAIRIELRTNLETTYGSHARLATQRQRYRGGPVHLRLDWSEVSALAQGADRLFLVTRGNDNTVLHHLEIDRTIFIRSRREIESALERMNQMVADPPRYCAFEENLREEENIVVT